MPQRCPPITEEQLRAAFARVSGAGWPRTLEAALASPVHRACLHGIARNHYRRSVAAKQLQRQRSSTTAPPPLPLFDNPTPDEDPLTVKAHLETTAVHANNAMLLAKLAHDLADRAVVADIECDAHRQRDEHGQAWYDTRPMVDPRELGDNFVEMNRQALDYAARRGLISPHPDYTYLVRIVASAAL